MSKRKYFGTDGIRGKVGEYPITPDFALKLGWAVGRVLAKEGIGNVLIGKDTRISGYMLESALEAGFASAGVAAAFTGPMPTPAITHFMIMVLNFFLLKVKNYLMMLKYL